MIKNLSLIRNVTQFDSVTDGANIPLSKFTLAYAENGRGKTTLAAIFRSLGSGDPTLIMERHRLQAKQPPHVRIECTKGPSQFQNAQWDQTLPSLVVYDDLFVDENIYSGLSVDSNHRQH